MRQINHLLSFVGVVTDKRYWMLQQIKV